MVDDDVVVLALLTNGSAPSETLHNVKEVQARGSSVIGLSSDDESSKFLDDTMRIPSAGLFEPLLANVHLQLFAYHVANAKGRPIDKPRNLAKSVTVK